jgi:hypothetical protein
MPELVGGSGKILTRGTNESHRGPVAFRIARHALEVRFVAGILVKKIAKTQRSWRRTPCDLCVSEIFLTNMPAAGSTSGASERTTVGGPSNAGSGDDAPVPLTIFAMAVRRRPLANSVSNAYLLRACLALLDQSTDDPV